MWHALVRDTWAWCSSSTLIRRSISRTLPPVTYPMGARRADRSVRARARVPPTTSLRWLPSRATRYLRYHGVARQATATPVGRGSPSGSHPQPAAQLDYRRPGRRRPAPRRTGRGQSRRPPYDDALRPGPPVTRPARHVHRRRPLSQAPPADHPLAGRICGRLPRLRHRQYRAFKVAFSPAPTRPSRRASATARVRSASTAPAPEGACTAVRGQRSVRRERTCYAPGIGRLRAAVWVRSQGVGLPPGIPRHQPAL